MDAFTFNSNSSSGLDFTAFFDPFSCSLEVSDGVFRSEFVSQSPMLDNDRGELVKTPVRVEKNEISEVKAIAALKSHSEAERRRRERINAHLDTLRDLVPCIGKMDKATVLAEVINEVKELKKHALEASRGIPIPTADDEVRVETCDEESKEGIFYFKASLCCDYRPELLIDLRQALGCLQLNVVKAEISTLGSRLKHVFVFTNHKGHTDDANDRLALVDSVHQALSSIVDKASAMLEYSPRTTLPNKRRRISFFDSSSSSS